MSYEFRVKNDKIKSESVVAKKAYAFAPSVVKLISIFVIATNVTNQHE